MQRPLAMMLLLALVGSAGAQDAVLDPQTCSVKVKLVNGTTGERGEAERVELREIGPEMRLLASAEHVADEITFPGVALLNFRPYLAVATSGGVAYRAQLVGQKFLDGEAVTVYVFDQTESLEGVSVSGMNVVVRRRSDGCELEYILTVENASRPQRTVAAAAVPARMIVPTLTAVTAEVYRGPEPEPAEMATGPDGMAGPRVALTPGTTRIEFKGFWSTPDAARLEIGCDLPVAAWSLMVSPATLAVEAPELTRDAGEYPGFVRLRGPALAPGQTVHADLPALAGDVAAAGHPAPGRSTRATRDAGRAGATGGGTRNWAWGLGLVASVGLLGFGLWRRRRR
jgi:hypothetical protein